MAVQPSVSHDDDGVVATVRKSVTLLPSAVHVAPRPRWSVYDVRNAIRQADCVRKAVTLPWCEATSGARELLIFNDDDSSADDEAAADEEVAAALATARAPSVRADDCRPPLRYNVAACRLSPLWNCDNCEPAGAGGLHRECHLEPIACRRSSASSAAVAGWPSTVSRSSNRSPLLSRERSRSDGSSSDSTCCGSNSSGSDSRYYCGGSAGAAKASSTHAGVAVADYKRASARRRHFGLRSTAVRSAFTLVDASSAMKVTGV